MLKWIIGVLAAIALVVGGVLAYNAYSSSDAYTDEPGVVYNNDGDGHYHDHGYFGVE